MRGGGVRLGVDFGTSSTTAVLAGPDGRVRPLLFDASPVLPSGVYVEPGREPLVGRDAVHAGRSRPECFEPYPKRCIDDNAVLLGGVAVPVEDLIAAVLRRVSAHAGADPPARVVLTCPVGWGPQRQARLLAAAGRVFTDPVLVPEPVAAATYYLALTSVSVPAGGHVLVYDLGAGTFDATLVRRTVGGYEVVVSAGLPDAGGLDIDAAIMTALGRTYAARDPGLWARLVTPQSAADRRASRTLWDDVRTGKEMLSRTASTVVHLPFFDDDAPLPREQMEDLARPVLDRTAQATAALLAGAGVAPSSLAGLFLVGGSSRMPLVASILHRRFGIAPTVVEQPELVVAEGSLHAQPSTSPTPAPPTPPPAEPTPVGTGPWPHPPPATAPGPATATPSQPVPRPRQATQWMQRTSRRTRLAVLALAALVAAGLIAANTLLPDGDAGAGPGPVTPSPTAERTTTPAASTPSASTRSGPPVVPDPRRVDVPDNGGKDDAVRHVTLSPNGKIIAAVRRKSVRLYNATTGEQIGQPVATSAEVYWTAAFSPDSQTLITAADGLTGAAVRVWDVAQRIHHGTLTDAFWTSCLTYGPTAKLLAICDGPGSSVRLWDPTAGRSLGRVDSDDPASIRYVAFSPDGRTLATDGGNGTTLLWNVSTRKRIGVLTGVPHDDIPLTDPGAATAFSPNGATLAIGAADGTITLWNVATHTKIGQLDGTHNNRVAALAFSPDGHTLASLGGTTLRIWNADTRQPATATIDGIADYYSDYPAEFKSPDLRFSPDGRTLIGAFNNHLLYWNLPPAGP